MLEPKAAQAEVAKLRNEEWMEVNLRDVGRLPAATRAIGRGLLRRDDDGNRPTRDWWKAAQAGRRRAIAQLDRESPAQRLKLFGVLFPKLEVQVEAAWQLMGQLPFHVGAYRRAFHVPRHRQYCHAHADDWLHCLSNCVSGFAQDITWWAAWAVHHNAYDDGQGLGVLFAATINAGGKTGDEVFDILCACAKNEHDIGGMGRHIPRALLAANRPEGWELMEKMLLAAQRQEGLRQHILEGADEAHPDAFRRMLRVILDHDLARFSAVVRAVDVWFAFQWDAASTRAVNDAIEQTLKFLDDDEARQKAITKGDGDDLYLALWTLAYEDAVAAVATIARLLTDKNVKRRFIAAHLLAQIALPPGKEALLPALADEDLRVAWRAMQGCGSTYDDDDDLSDAPKDQFEHLEKLLERVPPKGIALKALVWPWMGQKAHPRDLVDTMTRSLDARPPTRLVPHLRHMQALDKDILIDQLAKQKKWDATTRDTLFALIGDASPSVRESAVKALDKCKVSVEEAGQLEGLLNRKANDLRRGVIGLLLKQPDADVLASAERLLGSTDQNQRLAGLEILRELIVAKRRPGECKARIDTFQKERPRLTNDEQRALDAIAESAEDRPTIENALGLLDPAECTKPIAPKHRPGTQITPATVAFIKCLDDLVHQQRETEIVIKHRPRVADPDDEFDDEEDNEFEPAEQAEDVRQPLGEVDYSFPGPEPAIPVEQDLAYLPLAELWQEWWRDRPSTIRDKDGLEVIRARALLEKIEDAWDWDDKPVDIKKAAKIMFGDAKLKVRYPYVVRTLIEWLTRLYAAPGAADFILDAIETSYALVPPDELTKVRAQPIGGYEDDDDDVSDWRDGYSSPMLIWTKQVNEFRRLCPTAWTASHDVRFYQLQNWKDRSVPGIGRDRPDFEEIIRAYKAGGATRADLLDAILGPPDASGYIGFSNLDQLTARKPRVNWVKQAPELAEMVDGCRRRILEIELKRGETPTAASAPALGLESVWGTDVLVQILSALGKASFHRGYSYSENLGKACVLTHLVQVSYPLDTDTPAAFAEKTRAAAIGAERLIELAFKAPQWVKFVEHTLGWAGFAEGVWWFLAHTRDASQEIDKAWKALLSERTALTAKELSEGAVDVAWFHRAYGAVGPKRWPALDEAAKFASMAGGYRRARFLASVLLGQAKRSQLVADIKKKFLKESVRALGLLPLAEVAGRDKDLRERYQVLQDYHRYARGLSALSREGAVRAADVGMANLARTAGYPDPIRFQWAMEAAGCADLLDGVSARAGDVEVTLAVDALGQIEWNVTRKGQPVKSIPAQQRKDKKIAALLERKKELTRSQARMRRGLEDMMCRGDTFSAAELVQLMHHPLLAPMLGKLVVVGEGILGYPAKKGQALANHAGKLEPVKKTETLRLAHPHDLLETGQWHLWQHDAFTREIVQPFKQVFRELYVVTAAEKKAGNPSLRYAGHQVQPRQASALWAGRGWSVNDEDGIRKTFHDVALKAWVTFSYTGGTAAEVEGWTLEGIAFGRVNDPRALKLPDVPPRLFSEVMRDMDLVVSVAHRGGVDPEASASTVEMRGNLLRELCGLLKLKNVRQKNQHVLIDGQLGQYSVHLGSGGVHRMPGGAVFIVPVHAQHRGRLFLPFADDDPKSAEILSKVLLLARDQEIQDPSILDQLRR